MALLTTRSWKSVLNSNLLKHLDINELMHNSHYALTYPKFLIRYSILVSLTDFKLVHLFSASLLIRYGILISLTESQLVHLFSTSNFIHSYTDESTLQSSCSIKAEQEHLFMVATEGIFPFRVSSTPLYYDCNHWA